MTFIEIKRVVLYIQAPSGGEGFDIGERGFCACFVMCCIIGRPGGTCVTTHTHIYLIILFGFIVLQGSSVVGTLLGVKMSSYFWPISHSFSPHLILS